MFCNLPALQCLRVVLFLQELKTENKRLKAEFSEINDELYKWVILPFYFYLQCHQY